MASIKHLVDLDLNKNQLLNAVVQNLAVAPTAPSEGQIYWDTVDDTLYVWNADLPSGSNPAWIDLGSDGITNLGYTSGVSNGIVTSDSGDNATIPLADSTNAGLISAAEKLKLGGIEAGAQADQNASEVASTASGNLSATNVQGALDELQGDIDSINAISSQDLGITHNAGNVDITIDNGADIVLAGATQAAAGALSATDKAKLDGIEASAKDDQIASEVVSSASGNLTSTNVQSALEELQTELDTSTANNSGTVTVHSDVTSAGSGIIITDLERTKLSGIEALADVTNSTNVNAAGAVMNSDTTTAEMGFVVDEDNMSSNSNTKVPTQQSVKAYVDNLLSSNDAMVFKGTIGTGGSLTLSAFNALVAYDAGWTYRVITDGTYKGIVSEVGDLFIATVDRASGGVNADWTTVQTNIDGAVVGPASAVNNRVAFFNGTSGKLIKDSGVTLSGSNTGDELPASTTVSGVIEIATVTETNTGTDATRAVSPDGLDGWTGSAQITEVGTIATGVWNGSIIPEGKLQNQSGTNTGDEVQATTTIKGIAEIATQTEVNTGSDNTRIVTPATLKSTLGVTGTLTTALTYSALIGNGVLTSIVVTHGIGNQFVQANVYEVADDLGKVECEIELTSTTTTTFKFNVAPASNALRVVIIG